MCLAENVRTDHAELQSLAQLHNCDLRRLLLALQCWVESGGSAQPSACAVDITANTAPQDVQGTGNLILDFIAFVLFICFILLIGFFLFRGRGRIDEWSARRRNRRR